ncbi:hypothetical protein BC938DRAFT_482565 [Jimgerdemannia flammicorona]|uniref:SEC7 domain-containing protein n=1 Tax=Jimgerdemannia flammicorona TaxID=994334 RepID=A0A433R0C5_9FUNG|nr:hypothetical protein BC938DRAFT_482565 [Jimgerdemannia flammicorona]
MSAPTPVVALTEKPLPTMSAGQRPRHRSPASHGRLPATRLDSNDPSPTVPVLPSPVIPKCELTWSHLVHAEIVNVTSAMRRNSRWSGMSVSGLGMSSLGMNMGLRQGRVGGKDGHYRNQAHPSIMHRRETHPDLSELDASVLLLPFLEVIRSGDTTGPITGAALTSVEKFLQYGIVNLRSPNLAVAMATLSSAATHCKFEASDSVSDEVVLLKILQVLEMALTSDCGQVLSDEAVCEMMETGLSMCCQMRLSELLRRSAEHVMINMVQVMFERLKILEDEQPLAIPAATTDPVDIELRMNAPTSSSGPAQTAPSTEVSPEDSWEGSASDPRPTEFGAVEKSGDGLSKSVVLEMKDGEKGETAVRLYDEKSSETPKPYGLPAIRELLRVLISLLNPHDHQHTDSMRLMALSILNVALDVGGKSIAQFESLRSLVVDDFCKYLFQLARTDIIPLLTLTLRVTSTVFDTMRPYLMLQQELFLFFLIERLTPPNFPKSLPFDIDLDGSITLVIPTPDHIHERERPVSPQPGGPRSESRASVGRADAPAASGEVRELLLECLGQSARNPTFMVDLWVNYDCNLDCGDLFEETVKFLSKNSFPEPNSYSASNSHMLCLDSLLMFVNHMVDRIGDELFTSPTKLLELKAHKRILLEGAVRFNENSKDGIKFLKENGIIYNDPEEDPNTSLARFLMSTPRLNKKLMGDYLSKPQNIDILKAFIRLFDFSGKRIDEALRDLLETFRLPGEAQQIGRVVETFAETYFATQPADIASQDATFMLSYSVIMLNTDLHNPQVRRRMSPQDYMKNLRGVNEGQNFNADYLQAIYDAIRKREIVMPEEHEGQLGFNYAWKELLSRADMAGQFVVCNTTIYDRDIFLLAWKPTIAAISYAFNTAQDDATLQKAITGFHQCALLSAHYSLYDVFDSIVITLSRMTGLLDVRGSNETALDPIVDVAGQKFMVSELAVQFGRNYKGQLAAVVVFAVASEHGNVLREGWKNILTMIKNLFINSLLPSSMLQVEDFLAGTTSIPLKPKTAPQPKPQNRRDGSLLSALSSYLLSPYSNDDTYRADPTEEEVESTMCAVDCVVACRLEELFGDIRFLEEEPLLHLMKAIRHIGNPAPPAAESSETQSSISPKTTGPIPYDPAAVFFLELMISITIQNRDRIQILCPIVFEYVEHVLKQANNQSVLLIERAVVGLLRLCIRLAHKEEMVSEVFQCLELLLALPPQAMNSVSEQMMAGVLNLIKAEQSCITSRTHWETIFTLLSASATHPEASKYAFEATTCLLSESSNTSIHEDNFSGVVELLGKFANVAGIGADSEKETSQAQRGNRARLTKLQGASIDRARKAIEFLYKLHTQVPRLIKESTISMDKAWSKYWLPILTGLSQQCFNPTREVRQHALTHLQRALLLPELESGNGSNDWVSIFELVLFPLLNELLRPEVFQLDPHGIDEARMRASALLCKIFLHYFSRLLEWNGLIDLWLHILDLLDKYMNASENDHLKEAVPESLKNMILVMYTSGAFTKSSPYQASDPEYNGLWDVTWQRIGLFLPNLKAELFPPPPPPAEGAELIEVQAISEAVPTSVPRNATENEAQPITSSPPVLSEVDQNV